MKNAFLEGEFPEAGNVQNMHIANSDKPIDFYSFDVIISVGSWIKSQRGVHDW